MIDIDFESNVRHIRPYLGILLIGSMALGIVYIVRNATNNLADTLYAASPSSDIEGSIELDSRGEVRYGDTISYKTNISDLTEGQTNSYINTVCFQGETMVFEKSVQGKVSVHLYDEALSEFDWDGGEALCSATLLYRTQGGDTALVQAVDSVSFEVQSRGY